MISPYDQLHLGDVSDLSECGCDTRGYQNIRVFIPVDVGEHTVRRACGLRFRCICVGIIIRKRRRCRIHRLRIWLRERQRGHVVVQMDVVGDQVAAAVDDWGNRFGHLKAQDEWPVSIQEVDGNAANPGGIEIDGVAVTDPGFQRVSVGQVRIGRGDHHDVFQIRKAGKQIAATDIGAGGTVKGLAGIKIAVSVAIDVKGDADVGDAAFTGLLTIAIGIKPDIITHGVLPRQRGGHTVGRHFDFRAIFENTAVDNGVAGVIGRDGRLEYDRRGFAGFKRPVEHPTQAIDRAGRGLCGRPSGAPIGGIINRKNAAGRRGDVTGGGCGTRNKDQTGRNSVFDDNRERKVGPAVGHRAGIGGGDRVTCGFSQCTRRRTGLVE